jgi:hypothetical protein
VEEQVQTEGDRGFIRSLSMRPHTINYKKIKSEIEETILDLRVIKRFGCSSRIKFRLKRSTGVS